MQKDRGTWYSSAPENSPEKSTRAKGIFAFAAIVFVILSVVFFIIPEYSKYFIARVENKQKTEAENNVSLIAADGHDNTVTPATDSDAAANQGIGETAKTEPVVETAAKSDNVTIDGQMPTAVDAPSAEQHALPAVAESNSSSDEASQIAYTLGEPVPENSVAADEEYFLNSVFIGDSRTVGFSMHSGIKARFWGHTGLNVNSAPTERYVPLTDGTKVTIAEALTLTHDIKNIYISLGINEIGWYSSNLFLQKYSELVTLIKENSPDAVVYVQSVIPISRTAAETDYASSGGNDKIRMYNELIKTMCAELEVYYIDTYSLFADEDGNLPEEAGFDGVHLNAIHYREWGEYVRTHTIEK